MANISANIFTRSTVHKAILGYPKLKRIVDTIRTVLNKNRKGFVKPDHIKIAIQSAETDLYNELIKEYRESGIIPSKLTPFIKDADKTLRVGSTPVYDVFDIINGTTRVNGREYPAFIEKTGQLWTSQRLLNIIEDKESPKEPTEQFIKSFEITGDGDQLPDDFVKAISAKVKVDYDGASDIKYFNGRIVSIDRLFSREARDLLDDPEGKDQDAVKFNVKETTYATVDASGKTLPDDFVDALSFYIVLSGSKYEGKLVSPERFHAKSKIDLLDDGDIKKHLLIEDGTISLTSGSGDLPEDFVADSGVFYTGTGDSRVEGIILDSDEYLDRVQSDLLTPSATEPVARIVGGRIEVFPVSIASIELSYYQYPSTKSPIATIENGLFKVSPAQSENTVLKYYQGGTDERLKIAFQDNKVYLNPASLLSKNNSTITVFYYAFPVEEGAIIRLHSSSEGEKIQVKPSSVTGVTITYIANLKPSAFTWGQSGRDYVFDSKGASDTSFGEESLSDIVVKALKYLGVSIQDASSVQLEEIRKA